MRVRPDLLAHLKGVAAHHERSLSREIERRLTASLDVNVDRADLRGLLHLVREVVERLELMLGGGRFREDPYVFKAFEAALAVLLSNLRPEGPVTPPDRVKRQIEDLNARDLHFQDEWVAPAAAGASIGLGMWDQMTTLRPYADSRLREIAETLDLDEAQSSQAKQAKQRRKAGG
jgi:hypothetical protein